MNKENKEKAKSNVCLIKACRRLTHKESKYCIFHAKPEEKNEKKFKQALKKYINKIKREDSDYDFNKFIFVGNINFKKHFNVTLFKKANFNSTIFKGISNFEGTVFEENAFFRNAIFENAAFLSTTFKGNANFRSAIFYYANFKNSTFRMNANFRNVTFGTVYFRSTKFNKFVSFRSTIFNKYANFKNTIFRGIVSFIYATLVPGKKLNIKAEGTGIIVFEQTNLENVFLDLKLDEGVLIDFTNVLLKNTKINKVQIKKHILQEDRKKFFRAKEIYLLLKNNFHSIGKYEDESWAFKKEKDMERKNNCHFKTLHKWLWSCFLNIIYGYGERPERVIISAIAIIIVFTFVFLNFGIDANPQLDTIPKCNILKELFIGVRYGDLLIRLKDISWEQIKNCLYFSTVTFTTLGYGDFRPLEGWSRIFAGTEAFIGAFIIALFVYTFARRTGGR